MSRAQIYRLRAPASGRETLGAVEPGHEYRDRETGETMEPVAVALPLAAHTSSTLLRAPENLRACDRCDQLIETDISDCPYCGRRQAATSSTMKPVA